MEAYDGYDFVLDGLRGGYYVEETGEVELEQCVSAIEGGADECGELTDEASSARETVCCARVMVAARAASCGEKRVKRVRRARL